MSLAILFEVAATLSLRGFQDNPAWLGVVIPGYVLAFVFFSLALRAKIPVGVAYGLWGACGTAITVVLACEIFGDALTWKTAAGIIFIVLGVLLVELGSRPSGQQAQALVQR